MITNIELGYEQAKQLLAKAIGVEPDAIHFGQLTAEELSTITWSVRTDLATANKISRKLERLGRESGQAEPVEPA